MRIISGKLKGRKLIVPKTGLRPTTDRVRESLFNILGPMTGFSCLDLYAGSGAIGIEALSRGAKSAVFVEKDLRASGIIRKNLINFKVTGIVESITAIKYLNSFYKKNMKPFDFIFIDPPYYSEADKKLLEESLNCGIISENGVIIYEQSARESNPGLKNFNLFRSEKYGETRLLFFGN